MASHQLHGPRESRLLHEGVQRRSMDVKRCFEKDPSLFGHASRLELDVLIAAAQAEQIGHLVHLGP